MANTSDASRSMLTVSLREIRQMFSFSLSCQLVNLILFIKALLVVVGKNNCSVGYVFLSFDSNSFVLVVIFFNLLSYCLSVC